MALAVSLAGRLRNLTEVTDAEVNEHRVSPAGVVPFREIGLGEALTVRIEQVYLGNYPDSMPWFPVDEGDILVTSAYELTDVFEAAPRAIHALRRRPGRRTAVDFPADQEGTRLVYYSPAVTDPALTITFQLSIDREFDESLGKAVSGALAGAAALPVFATGAPFLLAASVAVPITQKAANVLARARVFFASTEVVNFDQPGLKVSSRGGLVIYPDKEDIGEFGTCRVRDGDFVLRDDAGKAYGGDLPYMVISLDGTPRNELEKWSSTALSAAMTSRFFAGDSTVTEAMKVVGEGMALYNDVTYERKARAVLDKLQTEMDDAARTKLVKQYKAYRKNVTSDVLKKSLPEDPPK